MLHKHSNKDLSHLWELSPGMWVNTRYIYIYSTRSTYLICDNFAIPVIRLVSCTQYCHSEKLSELTDSYLKLSTSSSPDITVLVDWHKKHTSSFLPPAWSTRYLRDEKWSDPRQRTRLGTAAETGKQQHMHNVKCGKTQPHSFWL